MTSLLSVMRCVRFAVFTTFASRLCAQFNLKSAARCLGRAPVSNFNVSLAPGNFRFRSMKALPLSSRLRSAMASSPRRTLRVPSRFCGPKKAASSLFLRQSQTQLLPTMSGESCMVAF